MQGIEILIKVVVCFAVFLKLNEFHVEVMSLDNIRQRYFDVICDRFSLISNVQMDKHFFFLNKLLSLWIVIIVIQSLYIYEISETFSTSNR